LRRLSPEDRRDIFGSLLEQKLATLPSSCLVTALDAYGQFVGKGEPFLRGLETLLASGRPECMRSALSLGFQHQAEPRWLAAQLEHHWSAWGEKDGSINLWHWWSQDPRYAETVLLAWSPSEACIRHLLPILLLLGGVLGAWSALSISRLGPSSWLSAIFIQIDRCARVTHKSDDHYPSLPPCFVYASREQSSSVYRAY
jgi:hypothetical protein